VHGLRTLLRAVPALTVAAAVVAWLALALLSEAWLQQLGARVALAAEPAPTNDGLCKYADGKVSLNQEQFDGSADGLLITLYDAHGVQVASDFLAEQPPKSSHLLLYARFNDVPVATAAKCFLASLSQAPLAIRRCRKAAWLHVDEGVDVAIREVVYSNGSLLLEVATRYIGMISGRQSNLEISLCWRRVG
jgi:hypothetical protein